MYTATASTMLKRIFADLAPGSRKQHYIQTGLRNLVLPYTAIRGKEPGKTILITAGIHGSEYSPIEASKHLAQILNPSQVHGSICIIHLVNSSGFRSRLAGVMEEDGKNLNRVFPGSEKGTFSQKVARYLMREWIESADFYLDMHGGDLTESLTPLVFYPTLGSPLLVSIARKAAEASGFPYLCASRAKTGAYNCALQAGVPALLTELGGQGLWRRQEAAAYAEYILNILDHLEVYPQEDFVQQKNSPVHLNPVQELQASREGFWYPVLQPGDPVKQGQTLGEIRDIFHQVLDTAISPVEGILLYQRCALSVMQGDFLAATAEITPVQ